ncbi:DUF885 family protein [Leifsonia poae]|uniref:DUF885 family protein n=1 Tax=Leifsonia poae TaxID=110933 RepID=UPI003D667691
MSAVRAIADRYVEALALHEPSAAQALGRPAADRLPDFSPEWAEARRMLDESTAAELRSLDPRGFSHADRALHAAMVERLESEVALFDTGFTPRLLAPLATPVHFIREAFDDTVVTSDDAGDAVLSRLAAVPATLADLRRRLEWSRDQGVGGRFSGGGVAGATQVTVVADQIASWIDPAGMNYFGSLRTEALDPARTARLAVLAPDATAAFASFEEFLRFDLATDAPAQDAVGEEVYQATSRAFLGSDLDLDEIYAFGWSELERLVAESRRIASEITGTPADSDVTRRAVAMLETSGEQALSGPDEIAAWLRSRVDQTIAQLDGTAFDLPSDTGEVECVVTEAASGVVYYLPGAPDGSSPSKIVWTIPRGSSSIATWHEVTSVHHEGVPGHHLEHSINRANASLHPWQRYLCEVHGYAEGWAHYAEGLADELGLIRTPAERSGHGVRPDLAFCTHRRRSGAAHRAADSHDVAHRGRILDAGARPHLPARPGDDGCSHREIRGRQVLRLAGAGARIQGRGETLARRARTVPRKPRRRLRSQAIPPGCAGRGPHGPRPAALDTAGGPMTTKGTTVHNSDPVAELHEFIEELYAHLADRAAFDERLHPDVTVWETADPRLLRGIVELDELRGPAIAPEKRTSPLPLVEPVDVVADRWGDTGVIRYRLEVRASVGEPIGELVRVTDVVRRGDSGWQIVHHHATDIEPATTPAGEENR